MCHLALENTILKLKKENNGSFEIPILYFTQLMGLAFGYTAKELGMERHLVETGKLTKKFKCHRVLDVDKD
jgi:heterodisulfide reductase subunit B